MTILEHCFLPRGACCFIEHILDQQTQSCHVQYAGCVLPEGTEPRRRTVAQVQPILCSPSHAPKSRTTSTQRNGHLLPTCPKADYRLAVSSIQLCSLIIFHLFLPNFYFLSLQLPFLPACALLSSP